jgi:hypothetical protein
MNLLFDIITREINYINGNFGLTENPSIQCGGIIEFSRCAFINTPMLGIGMEDTINANDSKTAYEMNRWQSQCKTDGATLAKWSSENLVGNKIQVNTSISYL